MLKKILAAVALLMMSISAWTVTGIDHQERQQNSVVMISVDMMRPDNMPCYGYERNTTPFLCSYAEENIFYRDAVAQATWTRPAQASVMTGEYPMKHGVYADNDSLDQSHQLIAEELPQNYSKAGFVGGADLNPDLGFSQGYDTYRSYQEFSGLDTTVPEAKKHIRKVESPYFLFVQGYDLHEPYRAPEDFRGKYSSNYTGFLRDYRMEVGPEREEVLGDIKRREDGYYLELEDSRRKLDDEDVQYVVDRYDEQLRSADARLRNLIESLKRRDDYEETAVIIYASHGEALGPESEGETIAGHGRPPYEDQVHVPLIVKTPENEDREVETVVELVDIKPTVLELAGIETQEETLLKPQNDPAFSSSSRLDVSAVIDDEWKYITNDPLNRFGSGTGLLIRRENNSANHISKRPEIAERLQRKLEKHFLDQLNS